MQTRDAEARRSESRYFQTAERMAEALMTLLLEKDFACITVKDICARAGVHRSTFYLHYETVADLLDDAASVLHRRFQAHFPEVRELAIAAMPRESLFLMTDRWLLPWLDFVRENQQIYRAIHGQMDVYGVERAYRQMFQTVFSPILSRYGVAEARHDYVMDFYRHGLVAILMRWVDGGCRESTGEIAEIIRLCVGRDDDAAAR